MSDDATATAQDEQQDKVQDDAQDVSAQGIEDLPLEDVTDTPPEKPDVETVVETASETETQTEAQAEETDVASDAEVGEEVQVETEAEAEAEGFTFDSTAYGFAANTVTGRRLAECTSQDEVLQVLANEHLRLQQNYGRHTQEVHDTREKIARLEAQVGNGGPATPVTAAGLQGEAAVLPPGQDPAKVNEWLQQTWEENPQDVIRYVAAVTRQQVQQQLEHRQQELLSEHDKNLELRQEHRAFVASHPDWQEHEDAMNTVAQDIGFWPTFEDCFEAALLSEKPNKTEYRAVVALMATGLPFTDAREFHELRAAKAGVQKDVQKKAHENAARRATKAGTAAGAPARGSTPAAEPVTATSIEDLPE